jgi:hypothetical protein
MNALVPGSIKITDALQQGDLADLIAGKTFILVVKNFVSEACRQAIEGFVRNARTEPYTYTVQEAGKPKHVYVGVDRIGTPFNSTLGKTDREQFQRAYYESALPNIQTMRRNFLPYLSPIDRLRLELDEIWPSGAQIAAFEGKKMFVGIFRVMAPELSGGSADHPHFDALPRQICSLDAQIAANIYISVPPSGGELEVWTLDPLTPEDRLEDVDGKPWRLSAPLPIQYKPEATDLVLFNSRRPHAVRAFSGRPRVSMQCFIGHRANAPLVLWN